MNKSNQIRQQRNSVFIHLEHVTNTVFCDNNIITLLLSKMFILFFKNANTLLLFIKLTITEQLVRVYKKLLASP